MKIKKIAIAIVTGLAVLLAVSSGIMKFVGGPEITATLAKAGVLPYKNLLGAMEISFGIMFLFRPTMKLGFILLTCYFSGALATELSNGMPLNAFLPLTVIWLAAYLRDRSIFLPGSPAPIRKNELV